MSMEHTHSINTSPDILIEERNPGAVWITINRAHKHNALARSVLAQLGNPDMRTALAHGLAWPERIDSGVEPLDLAALGRLEFEQITCCTFRRAIFGKFQSI